MDRKLTQSIILISLLTISIGWPARSTTTETLLKKILEKAKQNQELTRQLGFYQTSEVKKIRRGKVSEKEVRTYRVTWIEDEPYLQLLKINGKELNEQQRKEEASRRAKFVKSMVKEVDDADNITLDQVYAKYDFQQLASDDVAPHVFSFKPKQGKLIERSRTEKILNHVAGKVWVNQELNIVRAEAKLLENVRFGFGLLGKLDALEIKYQQQEFDKIFVPSRLNVHFRARIALLKTDERQIQATYLDFFRRPQ
jgi:hypothetical protein